MLWMLSALLLALWLFGMASGHTLGVWIHVLLVLAVISVCMSLVRRSTTDTI